MPITHHFFPGDDIRYEARWAFPEWITIDVHRANQNEESRYDGYFLPSHMVQMPTAPLKDNGPGSSPRYGPDRETWLEATDRYGWGLFEAGDRSEDFQLQEQALQDEEDLSEVVSEERDFSYYEFRTPAFNPYRTEPLKRYTDEEIQDTIETVWDLFMRGARPVNPLMGFAIAAYPTEVGGDLPFEMGPGWQELLAATWHLRGIRRRLGRLKWEQARQTFRYAMPMVRFHLWQYTLDQRYQSCDYIHDAFGLLRGWQYAIPNTLGFGENLTTLRWEEWLPREPWFGNPPPDYVTRKWITSDGAYTFVEAAWTAWADPRVRALWTQNARVCYEEFGMILWHFYTNNVAAMQWCNEQRRTHELDHLYNVGAYYGERKRGPFVAWEQLDLAEHLTEPLAATPQHPGGKYKRRAIRRKTLQKEDAE